MVFLRFSSVLSAAGGEAEYRIIDIQGEAGILAAKAKDVAQAAKGMLLLQGDKLVTGAKGQIELATKDGNYLVIKEKTSLLLEKLGAKAHRFYLNRGRLFAKFARLKDQARRAHLLRTPVTIGAVRGTELALFMEEDGELQAGVNEGQVVFGPAGPPPDETSESEAMESPSENAAETKIDELKEGEVLVESSQGLVARPNVPLIKSPQIPKVIVAELATFKHIREQIPSLRETWKDLDTPSQMKFRQEALRERVKWEVPPDLREAVEPPAPSKPSPEKPNPPKR